VPFPENDFQKAMILRLLARGEAFGMQMALRAISGSTRASRGLAALAMGIPGDA
jgi:hypothetical protein